jgi:DNA polymerase III delta subunit
MPLFEIIAKNDNIIDTEDIDLLVAGVSTHSIWDLTEAIEKENIEKYLNVLKYLFINGIKAPFIIGTLVTHYNKIYTAKFLLKSNFTNNDIGKILAQPSFILNRFLNSVKYFSDKKLGKILDLIYKMDMEAKTGGEDAVKLSLQNFIFQIKIV